MILSDKGIRKALNSGQFTVSPEPEPDQYTTSAVDLFLGDQFQLWDRSKFTPPGVRVELNLADQEFQKTASAFLVKAELEPDGSYVLAPYSASPRHLLAITREKIHLKPDSLIAARVEGRSSLARLGLIVHFTAPTIHAGFRGRITLEMINFGPFYLKLVPNRTRICQLIFERLDTEPAGEIATSFQGQSLPSGEKTGRSRRRKK